jgi:predicted lipoprotein with Yx(FWY)xxD motif
LIPIAAGLAVSGLVYLATSVITPDYNTSLFGQRAQGAISLKSWLASGVLAFAAFQVYSALWIYGRLPWRKPPWVGLAHRSSGVAAVVLSLPIAYHCLFAYGFRSMDRRTAVHSIVGCFFYGAVAAKLIAVRSRRLPGWALPVAGGTLVTLVVVLWYSAALWYFNNFDSPGLSPSVSAAAPAYSSSPGAASGSPVGVTVMARSTSLGTIVVDSNGRTLYLFGRESGSTSACYGGCTTVWPPVTTNGAARAGSGLNASLLGTTKRNDGTSQVTYNGHPLYYYARDSGPGQTTGEGVNQFGARWFVLSSSGRALEGGRRGKRRGRGRRD